MKRIIQLERRESGWWYQLWHEDDTEAWVKVRWQFGGLYRDGAIEQARGRFGLDYQVAGVSRMRVVIPTAPVRVNVWQTCLL